MFNRLVLAVQVFITLTTIYACGDTANSEAVKTEDPQATNELAFRPLYNEQPEKLNVLFVGNSYLAYNPEIEGSTSRFGVYHQIRDLIENSGIIASTKLTSIGGGTLKQHWKKGTAEDSPRGMIQSGDYDLIIIQGRYDIHERSRYRSRFDTYIDKFSELAKENNSRVLLYGLWAADNWISPEKDNFGPVAHEIYRQAAERNKISYAPNGMAYRDLYMNLTDTLSEEQIEETLTPDSVHPSTSLAYLAANVVYLALFGQDSPSVEKYLPQGISQDMSNLLRSLAKKSVHEYGYNQQ